MTEQPAKNSLQEGHGFGNHGFGAVESHISRKTSATRGFPVRGIIQAASAAFIKESRMKFINASRLRRKCRVWAPSCIL